MIDINNLSFDTPPKRVIVITTPTSATSSLWRIIASFFPSSAQRYWVVDKVIESGGTLADVPSEELPPEGAFLYNIPHLVNPNELADPSTLIVLNFRDPRDLVCNQYHWEFCHPNPHISESELEAKRQHIASYGLDAYALTKDNRGLYEPIIECFDSPLLAPKVYTSSFTRLCLDVESIYTDLCYIFGQNPADYAELMRMEHPANLVKSRAWIGSKWQGADFLPGRARIELMPETFKQLTIKYSGLLDRLRNMDDPRFEYFYSP